MRNIILFIRRYFNFLFFLVLQGFCLYMLFSYNRFHQAVFMSAANEITGKINGKYNSVEYYFQLKRTNDSLMKANARLYNMLKQDYQAPDSTYKSVIDSINTDSLQKFRRYLYLPAKVVGNSVGQQNNFIEVARGALQNVHKDIGVIDADDHVVGIVYDVSNNYSVVMSMLHKDSKISSRLKKTGEPGTVTWDGKSPIYVSMSISKGVKITKGDTVVTSGYTAAFPYGKIVGTVWEILEDKSTNYYTVKIKTGANFYNVQYVYMIDNLQTGEVQELLKRAQKNNE